MDEAQRLGNRMAIMGARLKRKKTAQRERDVTSASS
jgi:hypothetical protein